MKKNQIKNGLVIYQAKNGAIELRGDTSRETLWATLDQIAKVFGRDKSVISRHLKNIFKEGELNQNSVVAKNATTASDGKTYLVEYYNLDAIKLEQPHTYVVNGGPGTGKTILATYLIKLLAEDKHTKHLKIGLVVPMTSLRKSLKDVFAAVPGLISSMVIGPSEVQGQHYDLLIVDEAHRLRQRRNITNYRSHDQMNRRLGLGNDGTELDWILSSAPQQILFMMKIKIFVLRTSILSDLKHLMRIAII